MGPVAIGDVSEGPIAYPWRARVDYDEGLNKSDIYLARANAGNTDWEAETLLTTIFDRIDEMDLGFEQAARAVVCVEIGLRVFLYWFDPFAADFVFTDFDAGRTPRVILDDPLNVADSDILFFYISDTDDTVKYRLQRERYQIAADVPITDIQNKFLEDVFRTQDNRVAISYSVRNIVTGRYSLDRLESTLYPFYADDKFIALMDLVSGTLQTVLIIHDLFDKEKLELLLDVLITSTLISVILEHFLFDRDTYDIELDVSTASTLIVVILEHLLFDKDTFTAGLDVLTTSTLLVIILEHFLFDKDKFTASMDVLTTSTLEAA